MNNRVPQSVSAEIKNLLDELPAKESIDPKYVSKVFTFSGRKSISFAKEVISKLSNDRKYYLDPFFGSGNFLIAACLSGKMVTGIELDNYTYFAVINLLSKLDMSLVERMYKKIEKDVKGKILELYETTCPTCKTNLHIGKLYFDPATNEYRNPKPHREIENGKNIKFYKNCPQCKSTCKKFDDVDARKILEVNRIDTSDFPCHEFIHNSRINITHATGADRYDTNFTNRAKKALLYLQEAINNLSPSPERDLLESVLVSSISLSKICMYGSGTDNLYHVLIEKAQETNVWSVFESKYKAAVEYKDNINIVNNVYNDGKTLSLINSDYYKELMQNKYESFFDVIYTDPPYTDQVPYLEKSQYFRDWLKTFYKSTQNEFDLTMEMLSREVVISNAPSRPDKNNIDQYYQDVDKMFSCFSYVLKEDGLVVLTMKLGQKSFLSDLTRFITYARKNGFEYINKFAVDCKDPTIRKQAAFANTIANQYIIFFVKLKQEKQYWFFDNTNMDNYIVKEVYRVVKSKHPSYSEMVEMLKDLIFENIGYICTESDCNKIGEIIKSNFSCDKSGVYLDSDRLYLGIEGHNELFIKLYDYVPSIINKLLSQKGSFVLDDFYFELGSIICDGSEAELFNYLTDPKGQHNKQILQYLNYYCDEVDGKYIKKKVLIKEYNNRTDIYLMNPYEFEAFIKELLKKQGYKNVINVGGSGDRGVDLQATNTRGNISLIQCKKWIGVVGGEPIQRLHSLMTLNDRVDEAVCYTTSHYSSQAKNEAKATGVKIVDGLGLMATVEYYYPGKFYNSVADLELAN